MSKEVITRASDIPLNEIERVSGHGPEYYTLYLKNGGTLEVTRAAYNRARRLKEILAEDDVQAAVKTVKPPAPPATIRDVDPVVPDDVDPVVPDDVGLNG